MKAVVLTAYGNVDKLELRNLPDRHAERGALVVRMAGASLNPIDWKVRSGAARDRSPREFPAILGRDVSGTVLDVGVGVTSFAVGDRVVGLVHGSYAEQVVAPAEVWTKLPPSIDLVDGGALPLALLTGAQLIEEAVQAAAGDTVLVTGATGSVGRVAVHAAKMRGAKVWAGVRASQRDEAARLGVEGVVAIDGWIERGKVPTFDAIADTVGGAAIQRLYGNLKLGGTIGSVLGEPAGAKEQGFVVRAFMAHPDAELLAKYVAEVAEGRLIIPIAERMPLSLAREGHVLAEKKHPHGKVVLLG